MLTYIADHLQRIEADPAVKSREDVIRRIRQLGFGDFASVIWQMPISSFPKISSLLPRMVNEDVQRSWTGYTGLTLLGQSVSFFRSISANYSELTGRSLRNSRILDFGCGYGRFIRMAMFYSDEVWGVDPWNESIHLCFENGLSENILLSDYLPTQLRVPEEMDLIIAFSVFTHLSERAARTSLTALRRHIKPNGAACITIRPVEYWRMAHKERGEDWLREIERKHRTAGFAFEPHNRPAIDGDITYGDASMTLDWLASITSETGWTIRGTDRTLEDPAQRFVFLLPN